MYRTSLYFFLLACSIVDVFTFDSIFLVVGSFIVFLAGSRSFSWQPHSRWSVLLVVLAIFYIPYEFLLYDGVGAWQSLLRILDRILLLMGFIILVPAVWGRMGACHKVIGWVLLTHVFFFLLQLVANAFLSLDLNISGMFWGQESRTDLFGRYRATGLLVEPSTYSAAVVTYVAIRYLIVKKLEALDYATLLSAYLSLSTAAFVYVSLLLIVVHRKTFSLKALLVGSLCVGIATVVALPFLQERIDLESDSVWELKNFYFDFVFNEFGSANGVWFGIGLYSVPAQFEVLQNLPFGRIGAPNDNGLLFSFILRMGLIGVALVAVLFACFRQRIGVLWTIGLTKLSLFSPLTFVFWAFLICVRDDDAQNL